jgi:5'-phosphate synthase pdxT subunit
MSSPLSKPIGVLALQGDFAAHGRALERIGCPWIEVRTRSQLEGLAGLILPGGESTTLLKLIVAGNLEPALRSFHSNGAPLFGTCAGLILLATEVTHPSQHSLGLLDVTVERNSYGRQVDSFEAYGEYRPRGSGPVEKLEMVFIRAPRITRVGPGVQLLATCRNDPVVVATPKVLGATFHPEMTSDPALHELFLRMCRESQRE